MNINYIIKVFLSITVLTMITSCGSVKPQVPAGALAKKQSTGEVAKVGKTVNKKPDVAAKKPEYVLTVKAPVNMGNKNSAQMVVRAPVIKGKETKIPTNENKVNVAAMTKAVQPKLSESKKGSSYSNYIRVKTIYELATDANPAMFLPHDEFETADEYKSRVSEQVKLMKEIVQMTSQKMDIKKAQRIQVAKEKELKTRSVIENIMAESSSPIEFTPTDIGRYNPENETFPVILRDTQYQISVPRDEARTFKANFKSVKIKGVKQLKPKYDVSIKAYKAHIRSRPNGSIVGIASKGATFEHVQDEDEWYKINYKGQFGFTHMNNAELKLVDIDDKYEFHDMVAIHPTTGSMFAMISVDKLVKAPLNLASRKLYESGKPDGPDQ